MTFLLYIVIVLFGAPLTEKLFQTVAFAAYLSIVTIMPAFAALAPAEGKTWTTVFLQHCPRTSAEIYAYTQTVCALSGAWIGAIVLPLDWERDWQVWPISCIISTFLGHAVGVMAGLVWDSIKYIFAKRKSE
ncbi:phosphatidylinositol glycan, class F, isoform CRA_f [Radiomyces spectabilis]|uniref:phosphatidylinositol glycan, class F, isoform CRA_f n=1 Tax=Radiomyces spectabilis TaxID=64574 RepID=UPI00221F10D7|nr:phosphatidylinositol glycan, class F, isoform CRA_f [Radiomyces spectabilis]KAI8376237.1 phosphatidylinositol glycan, class F, isoform CRA_f [Radiomyces spectabilis]